MSFGYSVGDCIAVGMLAWTVYRSFRDAPAHFKNLAPEVASLRVMLQELEDVLEVEELSPSRKARLATIFSGCNGVLLEMQTLLERYASLGSKGSRSKRTMDRLRWNSDNVADLRARLTSNILMLAVFLGASQIVVQRSPKPQNRVLRLLNSALRNDAAFLQACLSGDYKTASNALRRGVNIDMRDGTGNTSLTTAFNRGDLQMVQWLVKKGANINAQNRTGFSPLIEAISNGQLETALRLYQLGADTNAPDGSPETKTPLVHAIMKSNILAVSWLIERRANVNGISDLLMSPLCYAIIKGKKAVVQLLLDNGARINRDYKLAHHVPLTAAIVVNDLAMVKYLLGRGADINFRVREMVFEAQPYEATALTTACLRGNKPLIHLLLSKGADVNLAGASGRTPLIYMAMNGDAETAKLFIKRGANVKAMATALDWAISLDSVDLVKLLITAGAKTIYVHQRSSLKGSEELYTVDSMDSYWKCKDLRDKGDHKSRITAGTSLQDILIGVARSV